MSKWEGLELSTVYMGCTGTETTSTATQCLFGLTPFLLRRTGSTRMGTNDRAIENEVLHIRVIGKVLMHFVPNTLVTPAGKSLVDALFQWPYSWGSKRHCDPLRAIHSTPSMKRRHFLFWPAYTPGLDFRN